VRRVAPAAPSKLCPRGQEVSSSVLAAQHARCALVPGTTSSTWPTSATGPGETTGELSDLAAIVYLLASNEAGGNVEFVDAVSAAGTLIAVSTFLLGISANISSSRSTALVEAFDRIDYDLFRLTAFEGSNVPDKVLGHLIEQAENVKVPEVMVVARSLYIASVAILIASNVVLAIWQWSRGGFSLSFDSLGLSALILALSLWVAVAAVGRAHVRERERIEIRRHEFLKYAWNRQPKSAPESQIKPMPTSVGAKKTIQGGDGYFGSWPPGLAKLGLKRKSDSSDDFYRGQAFHSVVQIPLIVWIITVVIIVLLLAALILTLGPREPQRPMVAAPSALTVQQSEWSGFL
jgi:F0F1-type ATP synthase assembly protein I